MQVGRIQVIAFQSSDGKQNQMSGPISLSPVNKTTFIDLESSLSSSEDQSVRSGARAGSPEKDTGDSIAAVGSWKVCCLFFVNYLLSFKIMYLAIKAEFEIL